ncbi:MAG: hypothetical protein WDZ83_00215 [Rhizobiaceae bacterium]
MKFRLRKGLGQSAARDIGSHLRIGGSGHHWVERFKSQTFILPGNGPDEEILCEGFAQLLEPIDDQSK